MQSHTRQLIELPGYTSGRLIEEYGSTLLMAARRIADSYPVRLKIARETQAIHRLQAEFEVLKNLKRCDDVLQAIEYQLIDESTAVLILEDFTESQTLTDWLSASQPNFLKRIRAALHLTKGLVAIHQQNILHGNLNPVTIFIRANEPGQDKIKLLLSGFEFAISISTASVGPDSSRLSGDLAFISPERTGHINRTIDFRSDLYSLGAVFYYMFTGQTPFAAAKGPLEIVHAHIARSPRPPHEINLELPPALSGIILKLLAKNSEERYQDAGSLVDDLQELLRRIEVGLDMTNQDFLLRVGNVATGFQISKKLYGRENELARIIDDFREHCGTAKKFLLVSGNSGIGKSALIASLVAPSVEARGYFAAGKYEPLRRDIPYNAVAQAVRDWIEQVLTESPADLAAWRESLSEAVGANGQVMADVIPEIEYLIGVSSPAQPLSAMEQRNRFNLIFRNFARVFTKHRRPLILFLDDLQWVDLASLELLELLLADEDSRYLYVAGAYRENDVEPQHPLWNALGNIKKSANNTVETIALKPLPVEPIAELIADTLRSPRAQSRKVFELANLVHNYTGGNPFFIVEYLKTLHQENLIWRSSDHWHWDLTKIKTRSVSNDIADLMAGKIQRLPENARDLLLKASCIGDTFELELLARIVERTPSETIVMLEAAAVEGLILPQGTRYGYFGISKSTTYRFVHDRVQQAAYASLSSEERRVIHRDLGRLLSKDADYRLLETFTDSVDVFAVANHLNLGHTEKASLAESTNLAWLNLAAGKRARASTAYRVSLKYFKNAADLLPREAWRTNYDLAIDLHRQWSECEYLSGNFDRAERLFNIALRNAKRKQDRADIYTFRIVQYTNQGRYRLALSTLLAALKIFDISLSSSVSTITVHWNILKTKRMISGLTDNDLLDREETHPCDDPEVEACIRLILSGMAPTYELAEPELFSMLSMQALQLSLQHGFTAESAFALSCYGITLSRWRGEYELAMRYGQLAVTMSEKRNHTNILCRNRFLLGSFIAPWREPFGDHSHLREGHKMGRESGNVIYGGYCLVFLAWHRFYKGENLARSCAKLAGYEQFFRNSRDYSAEVTTSIVSQMNLSLQGLIDDPTSLLEERFDEKYFFEHIWVFGLSSYYLAGMILAYLQEDYARALDMAADSKKYLAGTMVSVLQPEHYFYHGLTLSAIYSNADRREQKRIIKVLADFSQQFRVWSLNCPANFEPRYLLLEAERARIAGREKEAMRFYEDAIASARRYEFPQIEALASDLSARFYQDWKFPTLAAAQVLRARRLYTDWGATGRLQCLDRALPQYSLPMT